MRRAKYTKFRRLSDVLPKVVKTLRLEEAAAARPALDSWADIAGAKIAQHSKPVTVEGGVMVIAVDSPAWMTQLAFLKPQLLIKVAARIGKGKVSDLRFVLARPPRDG